MGVDRDTDVRIWGKAMWEVELDGAVRRYNRHIVERMLKSGELHGGEMVRPGGRGEWIQLQHTELFRAYMPSTSPSLQERDAVRAKMGAVVAHVGIFLVALVGIGPQAYMVLWGAALGYHLWESRFIAKQMFGLGDDRGVGPVGTMLGAPAPPSAVLPAARSELETTIAQLDPLLRQGEHSQLRTELEALRDSGRNMITRRMQLQQVLDPGKLRRLKEEAQQASVDLEAAGDDRTRAALTDQLTSLGERIEMMEGAAGTVDRILAQERTMVHQVESLRIAVAQAQAEEGSDADLAARVREMRLRADAAAEVEQAVARDRLAR